MDISAKTFFADTPVKRIKLIHQQTNMYPEAYRRLFLGNARKIAPIKSSALRRSIVTQVLGDTVSIGWRVPYAAAVDAGGHTDKTTHFAPAMGLGYRGRGYTTRPDWFHPYRTGSEGFKDRIVTATRKDMMKHIESTLGAK